MAPAALQRSDYSALGDPARVLRAVATNQLALLAPALYVRLTGQTGRGAAAEEGPADIARYFRDCVDAYFERLGVAAGDQGAWLDGKTLLEYGPGDLPGVALLMLARGARKVWCVDRFPLVNLSPKNAWAVSELLQAASEAERQRMRACLANPADPSAGLDPARIEYLVRPSGLSGLRAEADFVYSRAVLEHVDDLGATFADMAQALRPGACAIHQVDLRSHGLHKVNPLDFLAWSPQLWHRMYSRKGVPNRWRVDRYRTVVSTLPFDDVSFVPTRQAAAADVAGVRPLLSAPFRDVSDDDLAWLGFWLVMRRKAG